MPQDSLQPDVCVVMVSYHTGPCLWLAIDSVRAQQGLKELIVVDNGNPSEVTEALRTLAAFDARVKVLSGHGNIGFARGCNLGVAQADAPYLLLLNPDCLLPPRALLDAKEELQGFPSARLLGARIVDPDGREQRGSRRNLMTPLNAIGDMLGLGRWFPKFRLNLHEDPPPVVTDAVPAVSGAFLFCETEFFRSIGGMDERYFLHMEDMDFCLRVHKAGHAVVQAPHIKVVHFRSTSRVPSTRVERHKSRGFMLYFRSHGSVHPVTDALLLMMVGGLFVMRAARSMLCRKPMPEDSNDLRRAWLLSGQGVAESEAYKDCHVIVTGARGQVGAALVGRLARGGAKVVAVSRRACFMPFPRVRWVRTDLRRPDAAALSEAELIVHTAPLWHLPPLLEAVMPAARLKRVVAFGSTSVVGKAGTRDVHEREVVRKLEEAEKRIAELCDAYGAAWTLLRPTMIYGAGLDGNVSHVARTLRKLRFFPLYGAADGQRQPVHVLDLADAALKSLNNPAAYNKAYDVSGGETLPFRELVARVAKAVGRGRGVSIPGLPLWLDILGRLTGKKHLNGSVARRMNDDLAFDHGPATRAFGYAPRAFLTRGKADLGELPLV